MHRPARRGRETLDLGAANAWNRQRRRERHSLKLSLVLLAPGSRSMAPIGAGQASCHVLNRCHRCGKDPPGQAPIATPLSASCPNLSPQLLAIHLAMLTPMARARSPCPSTCLCDLRYRVQTMRSSLYLPPTTMPLFPTSAHSTIQAPQSTIDVEPKKPHYNPYSEEGPGFDFGLSASELLDAATAGS